VAAASFLRNVGSPDVHGAISQKMAFFIVTAAKTSDLTRDFSLLRIVQTDSAAYPSIHGYRGLSFWA
jgi:hypothetical protein